MVRRWSLMLRSLGEALLDVVSAEAAALRADLSESGHRLAVALGLAAIAAFLAFWAIGAAGVVLFQVLALWLPRWVAALILLFVLLMLALVFALVARQRLKRIEVPSETVRRRVDDHLSWWQDELLPETDSVSAARQIERDSSSVT